MKYAFIAGLLDFDIEGTVNEPIKVSDGILLTNNSKHLRKYINPGQDPVIGALEMNCILGGNPVLFMIKDVKNIDEARKETVDFMRGALAFLTALWVETDNSVNFELGFAISQSDGHVHSNSLANHFWTCTGEKGVLVITQPELIEIAKSSYEYFGAIKTADELDHTFQRKELGRVNMAGSFLVQARGTPDLGLKVANYCSYFEAMLSSNNVELSHQMAERAAFYLCESARDRLDHYKRSKRGYNVRSKVVHGDAVSKGQLKEIRDIAIHCDNVARDLFKKLMSDDEYQKVLNSGKNEELDSFMLNKIFGIEAVQPEVNS
jgi:hypothetical protein